MYTRPIVFVYIVMCLCSSNEMIISCVQTGSLPDLLATSGDYLRIWRVSDNEARQECLLNNVSIYTMYSLH